MGRQLFVSPLLLCLSALACIARTSVQAHPSYLGGCAHPTTGLGPHGAPVADRNAPPPPTAQHSGMQFAFKTESGEEAKAFVPGKKYTVQFSSPANFRAMLTASAGTFAGDKQLCSGRRVNFMELHASQSVMWTAPDGADVVGFAVTSSEGQEYRQSGASLGKEGVVLSSAERAKAIKTAQAGKVGGAAVPSTVVGEHDHAGMNMGMDMGGTEAPGAASETIENLHVVNLHVDSMHDHGGHSHGGGSWAGHVIPATMFTAWGIWWTYNAIAGAAVARVSGQPFRNRPWYPLIIRGFEKTQLRLLEPILKATLPALGIFCELYFHPKFGRSLGGVHWNGMRNPDGTFHETNGKYWQHASMYMFFVFSGTVDLVFARTLPAGSAHVFLALAFFMESFLFWQHLQTQSGLMAQIHTLLVYCIFGNAVAVAAELLVDRPSVGLAYAKGYFTMLQASWFWQIATALYGYHPWEPNMATEMMLPVVFCQHVVGIAVVVVACNHLYVKKYVEPALPK